MTEQAPQEIIDHVPGMEPYTGPMPSREVVPVEPTALVRANALNSPDRIGAGVLRSGEVTPAPDQSEQLGDTVVASEVQVVPSEAQPTQETENPYDKLFSPSDETPDVEAAAIRPAVTEASRVAEDVRKQMAISAADRSNREAAGLPPRTFDLR